jgi:hypothetical protein
MPDFLLEISLKKVWRYQRGNKKSKILFYFGHCIVCFFLFYFGHCTVSFFYFSHCTVCLYFILAIVQFVFILFWPLYSLSLFKTILRKLKISNMNPIYNRSELACSGREAVPAPHVAPIVINIMMGHNSCTLIQLTVCHEINMSSIIP